MNLKAKFKYLYAECRDIIRESQMKVLTIFQEIFSGAFSTIIGALALSARNIISLSFIGHTDDSTDQSAASFGITWVNSFGFSVLFGFAIGLGTMVSKAYGAKQYRAIGIYLQKSLLVMAIAVFLMMVLFIRTEDILNYFDMGKEFSHKVALHSVGSIISCIGYGIGQAFRYYLAALRVFYVSAWINIVTIPVQLIFCKLLIDIFDWGVLGMAIARGLTEIVGAGLYYLYLKYKDPCPEARIPWDNESYSGLFTHAKELVYHGSAIYLEWMALQISSLLVGVLKKDEVTFAHGSVVTYLVYIQSFTLGVSVSTTTYVGNSAGEGSETKAKVYALIGGGLEVIICILVLLVTLIWKQTIAEYYSDDKEIVDLIRTILFLYCLGMIADYGSNFLAFNLRTLNKQRLVTFCFVISYYIFGAPISYLFGNMLNYGIWGIWVGILVGYWVMFGLMIWRIRELNWENEVKEVQRALKEKESERFADIQHQPAPLDDDETPSEL